MLVTDIWVSLGQDEDAAADAVRDLEPYRVDDVAASRSPSPDAIVLHCLPAHPGEEIAADVLYGAQSAVWDEAENRLHVQKALLALAARRRLSQSSAARAGGVVVATSSSATSRPGSGSVIGAPGAR